MSVAAAVVSAPAAPGEIAVAPEVIVFTVKAKFSIDKSEQQSQPAPSPANQVAMKKPE